MRMFLACENCRIEAGAGTEASITPVLQYLRDLSAQWKKVLPDTGALTTVSPSLGETEGG